jgi:opacity protein-like surface antigen
VQRILIVALLAAASATACASASVTPTVHQPDAIKGIRTAYVVKHDYSTRGIEISIQKAIARRGIETTYGPMATRPDDVDVYVTYVDRWGLDLVMYLRSLKVVMYDTRTRGILATSVYKNSLFHSYPNPDTVAQQIVDSILSGLD